MSTEPKQYRQRPLTVEAVQFPLGGTSQGEVARWVKDNGGDARLYDGNARQVETPFVDGSSYHWASMTIRTREGLATVMPGDYIIRNTDGSFTTCLPLTFHETYEDTK